MTDRKIKDLKDARPYLNADGQRWVDVTVQRQITAVHRPRARGQFENDEDFHPDNLQDEDVYEEVDVPEPHEPDQ